MVFVGRVLHYCKRLKRRYNFIDSVKVQVVGGTGGTGLPKYGGVGGQGGCVYCIGNEKATFYNLIKRFPNKTVNAKNGMNSHKHKLAGATGEDVMIPVPIGIRIFTDNRLLGEINKEKETLILARGGPGGDEKNGYLGIQGQSRSVTLDLRLIADVGFVGFPNAGKSTILKAISKAKPKVAAYPFTTIRPNIGVLQYTDHRQIALADLPGLIEGAHKNIGMGHTFLKHVERTRLLMIIADVQGFSLSVKHPKRTCFETILLLNKEIELYDPELLKKPALLVINKMDTEGADKKYEETLESLKNIKKIVPTMPEEYQYENFLDFVHTVAISAKCNPDDIEKLRNTIRLLVDEVSDDLEMQGVRESMVEELKERGPAIT